MPLMSPVTLVVNLTPSSTDKGSPESGMEGTVESGHRLHGHVPAGGVAWAVMNVFVTVVISWPKSSCAPLTVTVTVVPEGSAVAGVKVATVSVELNDTVPGTLPAGSARVNESVLGTTALLNVTVGSTLVRLLEDPGRGVWETTAGGTPGGS